MNVFITGGTSGIGRELALLYLKEGCRVGVCGGEEADFRRAFPQPPANLRFYRADVSVRAEIKNAVAEFSRGELDLLVACAGINNGYAGVPGLDFDRELRIMEVNLLGVMHSFEAALALMLPKRAGRIAAVSSASGVAGFAPAPAYCASKAAVLKLCESYAQRFDPLGIGVTALAPGYVRTPLTAGNPRPMKFSLSAEEAARRIHAAIARGSELHFFPWPAAVAMWFVERMPRWLFRRIGKAAVRRAGKAPVRSAENT